MPSTKVKPHYTKIKGKRVLVKAHKRKTVGSKAKGRSGDKFKKLSSQVTKDYLKKGYSKKRAKKIGQAVAGKVFWRKFGKRTGSRILRRER